MNCRDKNLKNRCEKSWVYRIACDYSVSVLMQFLDISIIKLMQADRDVMISQNDK